MLPDNLSQLGFRIIGSLIIGTYFPHNITLLPFLPRMIRGSDDRRDVAATCIPDDVFRVEAEIAVLAVPLVRPHPVHVIEVLIIGCVFVIVALVCFSNGLLSPWKKTHLVEMLISEPLKLDRSFPVDDINRLIVKPVLADTVRVARIQGRFLLWEGRSGPAPAFSLYTLSVCSAPG